MGDKTTHIRFDADGPALHLGDAPWLVVREFVDVLARALAAMPDGPPPGLFRPVKLVEGSIGVVARVDPPHVRGAGVLLRGPSLRWTPEMHRGTRPLYDFLHRHDATLKGGQRRLRLAVVPPPKPPAAVATYATHAGTVELVGGADPRAHIRFEDADVSVVCSAARDTIAALGRVLYQRVLVSGEGQIDTETGRYEGAFRITRFEVLPPIDPRAALRKLHEQLLREGVTLDPEQMLRDIG